MQLDKNSVLSPMEMYCHTMTAEVGQGRLWEFKIGLDCRIDYPGFHDDYELCAGEMGPGHYVAIWAGKDGRPAIEPDFQAVLKDKATDRTAHVYKIKD